MKRNRNLRTVKEVKGFNRISGFIISYSRQVIRVRSILTSNILSTCSSAEVTSTTGRVESPSNSYTEVTTKSISSLVMNPSPFMSYKENIQRSFSTGLPRLRSDNIDTNCCPNTRMVINCQLRYNGNWPNSLELLKTVVL